MDDKKIKIAYLITGLNTGGAQIQLYNIITKIDKSQFDVFVISIMDGGSVRDMIFREGVKVYGLGIRWKFEMMKAAFRLYSIIKKEKPDILHNHMYHANVLGSIVGFISGVPTIISTIHNIRFGGKFRELIIRLTQIFDDQTTIVSEIAGKRMIKDKIVAKKKLEVIPNGIETEIFKKSDEKRMLLRKYFELSDNDFVWLAVGIFEKGKNYPCLLRSFLIVLRAHPKARIFIVGNGRTYTKCFNLARKLGISKNVLFLSLRKDIPDLLNLGDAFVMSSLWEGMPIAIMEASSMELPIVSTSVGGVPELVINNKTGFLVNPNNEIELAEAMIKMMELPKIQRENMGAAARRHIQENYEINDIVDRRMKFYNQVSNKKIPS